MRWVRSAQAVVYMEGRVGEHLQRAAEQYHLGAAHGVVQAARKVAGDHHEDRALLADPT